MNAALTDLERFLHEQELPLLVQLAIAHYQFETIHPSSMALAASAASSYR